MSGRVADDNRQVVERIARGDRGALAELYTAYQVPLFRYLLGLTADRGVAEEILQDTLLAVWKSAGTFEGRSSVQTWLIGIARRQAHNTLRKRALPRADLAELELLPDRGPDPEDEVLARAARDDLAEAIRRLAPVHREILTLTFNQGLSYSEMARICGVPEGTIKSRLSNAKRALRALLIAAGEVGR
jgi:RNA polymerase sigma-70 factor (ECF subfamily)